MKGDPEFNYQRSAARVTGLINEQLQLFVGRGLAAQAAADAVIASAGGVAAPTRPGEGAKDGSSSS